MKYKRTSLIFCTIFLLGCKNFNGTDTYDDPSNNDPCKSKKSNSFLSDNSDELSKIVFSMPDTISGESQIFVMNNDGSELQQITCSEQNEASNPSFSPDASQIVFTTTRQSTTLGPSIFFMNSDGSDIRPMKLWSDNSETAYPGRNPKWSPDGTKIAFDWCINCEQGGENTEIFIYDFETDSVVQVTTHPSADAYPAWSPDSERLVFTSSRDYYDADTLQFRADLYTIELSKSAPTRLTNFGDAGFPIWFPDEERVTFSRTGTKRGLYNIELYSRITTKINDQYSEESLLYAEAYSPSGDRLLVKVRDYPFDELYIMDMNSGQSVKVNSKPRELIEADWSYKK